MVYTRREANDCLPESSPPAPHHNPLDLTPAVPRGVGAVYGVCVYLMEEARGSQ